jgi:hypothetical protein
MIEGFVDMPSLGLRGFVLFMIDTGADCTVLMPKDAAQLKIDYKKLTKRHTALSAGGPILSHLCQAKATFAVLAQTEYEYDVVLRLPKHDPALMSAPSILGLDVLNRWQLSLNPQTGTVIGMPQSWDRQRPL